MEVGGDFELDVTQLKDVDDHLFNYLESYDTVYTDSGRSALRLLKRTLPKGKVLLPAYICESVIKSPIASWLLCSASKRLNITWGKIRKKPPRQPRFPSLSQLRN